LGAGLLVHRLTGLVIEPPELLPAAVVKKSAMAPASEVPFGAAEIASERIFPYAPATDSRVGQLQKLAALRESGALTEEEFAAEKAKLLTAP
jgi:hypothetical protein